MMPLARVQSRGQVTIPQEVREACGIGSGADLLFVDTEPGRFACLVLPAPRSLLELVDEYAADGVAPDLDALRRDMAEDITRDQREECLAPKAPRAR